MLKIDAHQHFWKFDEVRDNWITEDMSVIRRDFLPEDLKPVLDASGISGCVVVQSDQSPFENEFQLRNAAAHDFIKGVVGWVDLQSGQVEMELQRLSQYEKLKGFRHVLQGETDRALMLKPAFLNGISRLKDFGFTYDILIFPDQLKYAAKLASQFPGQAFVLDHIAKPTIKNQEIKVWEQDIRDLAALDNVNCKISGLVTEANWNNWNAKDFEAYLDVVFEAFGPKRVMYGSDWPVCLLAGSYEQVKNLVGGYVSKFSDREQAMFWAENAIEFYNLK